METPQKDRELRINLPHFNYEVFVIFTEDFKEYALKHKWKKFYGQIKDDERSANAYHGYSIEDCCSWMMFSHDPSIKTIAHECFHVVWRVMEHIGAGFENEVMAYHMGYLVDRVTANLYKYGPGYEEVRAMNKKSDKMSK